MTSTAPESPDTPTAETAPTSTGSANPAFSDPASANPTDPSSNDPAAMTSDEAVRSAAWFRTLLVATAAVGLLVLLALASGGLGDDSSSDAAADTANGSIAPEDGIFALPFTTIDGGTGTLSSYHGQPLVVNFFASWCPPCRAELPDFEAVHQQLGDEVTFIGVNQDFTEESWKSFVAEAQISYDTVFQPQSEIWSEIATQAMPTTVFISPDGEIEQVWAGLITDDKLEEVINETLLEPSS